MAQPPASSSNSKGPRSYGDWSKEALIERLRTLEALFEPDGNNGEGGAGGPPPKKQARKQGRPFDFSTRRYRNIALKVAYLGYDYYGLASQPTDTVATIESALFQALRKTRLVPEDTPPKAWSFSRCGRTDRGVSAFGQVLGLRVRSALMVDEVEGEATGTFPWAVQGEDGVAVGSGAGVSRKRKASASVYGAEEDLKDDGMGDEGEDFEDGSAAAAGPTDGTPTLSARILAQELDYPHLLNNVLPPDIRVLAWAPVAPGFDARFSCTSRRYKYFFVRNALDIPAMERAAGKLQGVDLDFRNFCKPDISKRATQSSFRRSIVRARILRESGWLAEGEDAGPGSGTAALTHGSRDVFCFEVVGSAFLWHQVRCMMAVLFRVGQGLEQPEVVDALLDMSRHPGKVGRPAYEMASEIPLSLVECGYAATPFAWVCRLRSRSVLCRELRQQHDDLAIRMAHLESLLHEVLTASGPCVPFAAAGTAGSGAKDAEEEAEGEDLELAMQRYTLSRSVLGETSHPARYVALMQRRRCAPLTPFVKLLD
jgi:tRNA pseudouridine38/39 synthase